jgi:hypothetical protein
MTTLAHLRYHEIADLLDRMDQEGGFTVSVLTDENGFPLAATGGTDASEEQAAVVAQIQRVVLRVQDHLSMAAPEEITLNDINGKKLVCRSFDTGGMRVLLAVLVPSRGKSYRKLMNQAIHSIQKAWEE